MDEVTNKVWVEPDYTTMCEKAVEIQKQYISNHYELVYCRAKKNNSALYSPDYQRKRKFYLATNTVPVAEDG